MGLCVSSPDKPIPSKHSVLSTLTRSAPVSDQRREAQRCTAPSQGGIGPWPGDAQSPHLPRQLSPSSACGVCLSFSEGQQAARKGGPGPGGRRAGRYFSICIPATLGLSAQPAPLGMATSHAERAVSGGTHHPLLQRAGRRAGKTRTSRPDRVPRPPRAHTGETEEAAGGQNRGLSRDDNRVSSGEVGGVVSTA